MKLSLAQPTCHLHSACLKRSHQSPPDLKLPHESASRISTHPYVSCNLEPRCDLENVELAYNLAILCDLEDPGDQDIHYSRTIVVLYSNTTMALRLNAHEAVKFNDYANPLAAREHPFQEPMIGNSGSAFCSATFFFGGGSDED